MVNSKRCEFSTNPQTEIYAKTLRKKATASKEAGTITNLLSVDSFQGGEVCSYVHDIFPDAFIQLAVAAILLFYTLGWSAMATLVTLAVLFPSNAFFARSFARAYKAMNTAMDARIDITNQVLQNAKLIKVSFRLFKSSIKIKLMSAVFRLGTKIQSWRWRTARS